MGMLTWLTGDSADTSTVDFDELGKAINALPFETVFKIENGEVVKLDDYAPTVMYDPDSDVEIDSGWRCVNGMTGQYGYHGAVMHPSEYIGSGIAQTLYEHEDTVFAIVTVDAYPEDDDGESESGVSRSPHHAGLATAEGHIQPR